MSAGSKDLTCDTWMRIRDGSNIDKSPLTFHSGVIVVRVRKGSQDVKVEGPRSTAGFLGL